MFWRAAVAAALDTTILANLQGSPQPMEPQFCIYRMKTQVPNIAYPV